MKNGTTHTSHCGQICPQASVGRLNQRSMAAINPHAQPRCSTGSIRAVAIMAMRGDTRDRWPHDFEERRLHQANGMGGVPITGDPDTVAHDLAELAAAGARGIALSFVNFADELPYFRDEVLPRLQRLGLRAL